MQVVRLANRLVIQFQSLQFLPPRPSLRLSALRTKKTNIPSTKIPQRKLVPRPEPESKPLRVSLLESRLAPKSKLLRVSLVEAGRRSAIVAKQTKRREAEVQERATPVLSQRSKELLVLAERASLPPPTRTSLPARLPPLINLLIPASLGSTLSTCPALP